MKLTIRNSMYLLCGIVSIIITYFSKSIFQFSNWLVDFVPCAFVALGIILIWLSGKDAKIEYYPPGQDPFAWS
jgi:hypothetical protein